MYITVVLVPAKVIVLVPVAEILKGVAPPSTSVAVCAPFAIEKIEVLAALPVDVVTVPFTVSVPLAKLNTPFAILVLALPIRLVIVKLPVRDKLATVEVKV